MRYDRKKQIDKTGSLQFIDSYGQKANIEGQMASKIIKLNFIWWVVKLGIRAFWDSILNMTSCEGITIADENTSWGKYVYQNSNKSIYIQDKEKTWCGQAHSIMKPSDRLCKWGNPHTRCMDKKNCREPVTRHVKHSNWDLQSFKPNVNRIHKTAKYRKLNF